MTFILINAGPSPFGRKVAVALIEKRLNYVVQYDVPWSDQTCTPQYSPLEQLPILIKDDGSCIYDSSYILEWLERRYPDPPLLPAETDAALEAKLRQVLAERMLEILASIVFELKRPDPSAAWVDRQERKVRGALRELDRMIGGRVVTDNQFIDLGDIAVGTTLLAFESAVAFRLCPDIDVIRWRNRYPSLNSYMATLEARPSFAATAYRTMDVDLAAAVR